MYAEVPYLGDNIFASFTFFFDDLISLFVALRRVARNSYRSVGTQAQHTKSTLKGHAQLINQPTGLGHSTCLPPHSQNSPIFFSSSAIHQGTNSSIILFSVNKKAPKHTDSTRGGQVQQVAAGRSTLTRGDLAHQRNHRTLCPKSSAAPVVAELSLLHTNPHALRTSTPRR